MKQQLIVLAIGFLLSACTTISKDQCEIGNWDGLGYSDGVKGRASDRFEQYNETCAKYNVRVNLDMWLQGYNRGLLLYCTADHGAWVGQNGSTYNDVCSGPAGRDFSTGYHAGRQVFLARQSLQRAQHDYTNYDQRLDELYIEIQIEEEKFKNKDLSEKERTNVLNNIRYLERRYGRIEQQLQQIERTIEHIEQDEIYLRQRLRETFPNMRAP